MNTALFDVKKLVEEVDAEIDADHLKGAVVRRAGPRQQFHAQVVSLVA